MLLQPWAHYKTLPLSIRTVHVLGQWTSATWVKSSCSLHAGLQDIATIQSILLQKNTQNDIRTLQTLIEQKVSTRIGKESRLTKRRTGLHFLLTDVAYEIFTEEIVPQPFVDEPRTVFSRFMAMGPVVRLTRLPLPAGKQKGAIIHQVYSVSSERYCRSVGKLQM